MRTTLEIDDDVYLYARDVAASERTSIGKTISRFLRERLQTGAPSESANSGQTLRNGFSVIPRGGRAVSLDTIQTLMDNEGI